MRTEWMLRKDAATPGGKTGPAAEPVESLAMPPRIIGLGGSFNARFRDPARHVIGLYHNHVSRRGSARRRSWSAVGRFQLHASSPGEGSTFAPTRCRAV